MKLYSYIIVKDRGLAPNPFWGYCTLAVCTPNHMGIKPEKGDWIVGISPKSRGNKLVYAMQVDETLHFDMYFKDERFQEKKPDMTGPWKKRCGDNFYHHNENAEWVQFPNPFHDIVKDLPKDTKNPFVFISKKFYYFGGNQANLPGKFTEMVLDRQGCKKMVDQAFIQAFDTWLEDHHSPGVNGEPKDRDNACSDCC